MTTTTKESIEATAAKLGLTMKAEFVPFSQSRSAGEKQPTLNWKVTLFKTIKVQKSRPRPTYNPDKESPIMAREWLDEYEDSTRPILTTDYSAGQGHCPSYRQGDRNACRAMAVDAECETGYAHRIDGMGPKKTNRAILPSLADVLYSLASDSDVIDCGTFEEWADNLGYDKDSRKAEGIYRACLETALKLRNALGDQGLATLREAVQDY